MSSGYEILFRQLALMRYPATNAAQRSKMIGWIASGFERYGAMYVDLNATNVERIRAEIRRYSDEFGRMLGRNADDNGLDLPELREDLIRLMEQNCPPVDIVELMMRCTSKVGVVRSVGLHYLDISRADLLDLERCYRQAADTISQLLRSGPLVFVPGLLVPNGVYRAVRRVKALSKRADSIARRLDTYEQVTVLPWFNAFLKDGELGFFYKLLESFHCGYPTLSRLLRAMRNVRHIVDDDAGFPRVLDPKVIKRSTGRFACKSGEIVRDPFSEFALQQRLYRFFEVDAGMTESLKKRVQFHYSGQWAKRRGRGESLMESVDEVWMRYFRVQKFRQTANSRSTMGTQTSPRATKGSAPTTLAIRPSSCVVPSTPRGRRPPDPPAMTKGSTLPPTNPDSEFPIYVTYPDDDGHSSAKRK